MAPDDWEAEYKALEAAADRALAPGWGVRRYRGHNTHDGVAYAFTLTLDGKPVAEVEDEGRGGAPMLWWHEVRGAAGAAWEAAAEAVPGGGWMGQEMLVDALLRRNGK